MENTTTAGAVEGLARRKRVFLAAVLVLSGCQQAGTRMSDAETGDLGAVNQMRKWTDPTTGCVYLIYEHNLGNASTGGLSIRFKADGTADCPGDAS